MIYDTIIIGGGPAGYTAGLYASRAGLSTLIIERMSAGGQMTQTGDIDNYPGFWEGIDGFTLGEKMRLGAERFGANTVYDEVVEAELFGEIKKVVTSTAEYSCRTVIIATGADPRKLGIPDEEKYTGRGIHYCAHCDGRFYRGKTALVVGGGNSALEDALYLSKLAAKVYLVHRRGTFRASRVYIDALEKSENIELVLNSNLVGFVADKRVSGASVSTDGKERLIDCDGIFVSVGRVPKSGLFTPLLQVDAAGYICAGEDTRTSIPGVFAAGDVRTKELRQVVTAAADGATAAHFAQMYLNE